MKKSRQQKEKSKAKKMKYRMKKKGMAQVSSKASENDSMQDYVPVSQVISARRESNGIPEQARRKWLAKNAGERADIISEFCESKSIGKVNSVFHDPTINNPHIDLLIVESAWNPGERMLVTSGMSSLAMTTPYGSEHLGLAELFYYLPEDWTEEKHSKDKRYSWHVMNLLHLASHPHTKKTWFGSGHTVDQKTLMDLDDSICQFSGYALDIPSLPEHLPFLTPSGNSLEAVQFLQAIPLYAEEILETQNYGGPFDRNDLFTEHFLHGPVDINRKNFALETQG